MHRRRLPPARDARQRAAGACEGGCCAWRACPGLREGREQRSAGPLQGEAACCGQLLGSPRCWPGGPCTASLRPAPCPGNLCETVGGPHGTASAWQGRWSRAPAATGRPARTASLPRLHKRPHPHCSRRSRPATPVGPAARCAWIRGTQLSHAPGKAPALLNLSTTSSSVRAHREACAVALPALAQASAGGPQLRGQPEPPPGVLLHQTCPGPHGGANRSPLGPWSATATALAWRVPQAIQRAAPKPPFTLPDAPNTTRRLLAAHTRELGSWDCMSAGLMLMRAGCSGRSTQRQQANAQFDEQLLLCRRDPRPSSRQTCTAVRPPRLTPAHPIRRPLCVSTGLQRHRPADTREDGNGTAAAQQQQHRAYTTQQAPGSGRRRGCRITQHAISQRDTNTPTSCGAKTVCAPRALLRIALCTGTDDTPPR